VVTLAQQSQHEQPEAPSRYLNREISSLDFNERVLQLAEDATLPLLERAKFLAIVASNLDEFYMVRVAGLVRQQAAGVRTVSVDGLTATQQLAAISDRVGPLMKRVAEAFCGDLMPALSAHGVRIARWQDLTKEQRKDLKVVFRERIFPVLTPLAVDPGHPFPFISNRSLNLAVSVRDEAHGRTHFARVKVPPLLPRLLPLDKKGSYVPLEDVIGSNLDDLFPGMKVIEYHNFRVTRDSDLEVDDDGAEDLLSALEQEITRRRFSRAVRLEVERGMPEHVQEMLVRELQLGEDDVFELQGPLDLTFLFSLHADGPAELKYPPFQGATHPDLISKDDSPADIFAALRKRDILVQHPYESFTSSVQHFIDQAAADPNVLAIKQTLYRTSGESPIVDALIEAAEAGKQVVVLVEIKARFDEMANINWARTLERAGCHVVYGVVGLKTHCKLCLVVRQEADGLRRYVHIGTGNYNSTTARLYEDFGLLTADKQLGSDVGDLFNSLTGYAREATYASLVVAPREMRSRLVDLIARETRHAEHGKPARIIMKLNSLVDETIIDALYDASRAGVEIDIVARSICSLRPGVPGISENIRVKSIVGRFLEHSRAYYFSNAGSDDLYIGSADMMHRNLDRRVEVLVRVESKRLKRRLHEVLDLALKDNTNSWTLAASGDWARTPTPTDDTAFSLQVELMRRAGGK
jgi:polyphosphate kinase